jgi:hypothetical protein
MDDVTTILIKLLICLVSIFVYQYFIVIMGKFGLK